MKLNNKILIFDSDYPDKRLNSPGDEFVRSRAKEYKRRGFSVEVIGLTLERKNNFYRLDGINIFKYTSKSELINKLNGMSKDEMLFIHFIPYWLVKVIIHYNLKCFVWVHGWEALGWYRRLYLCGDRGFLKYILGNIRQLYHLRQLIKFSNKTGLVSFVFVSKWMKSVAESDMLVSIKKATIIPNPIERTFIENKASNLPDVLVIRSFENRKYATDIISDFILSISLINPSIKFHVYGCGKYWKQDTKPLKRFDNINLYNRFLSKEEILKAHSKAGFFLCPTRQDAQGVSMCEAMGSGLIPITNPSTAIPEFVLRNVNAICEKSHKEMTREFIKLYRNRNLRKSFQAKAKQYIASNLAVEIIADKELCLLK